MPELSVLGGMFVEFVLGLKESQSTLRTKFRNTSRVYQRRPKLGGPGLASRMEPKIVRKSPPPAICQPTRPVNNGLNTGLGGSVRLVAIASAVLRASVVAVREGLADPMTGNKAGPAT